MKPEEKDIIDFEVVEAIMEKPISFTLDGRFFYLYPPSLGISFLTERIIKRIEIDMALLQENELLELMRVAETYRNDCLRLIAIHSFSRRSDSVLEGQVKKRMEELEELSASDIGSIIKGILYWSTLYDKFVKRFYLHKEKERRKRIQDYKDKKQEGGVAFGGKSIYGVLIDFACERYGWQLGYVVWGVSFLNLNMMMADAVSSVYLSKKEMKEIGMSKSNEVIDADDPKNREKLIKAFKNM